MEPTAETNQRRAYRRKRQYQRQLSVKVSAELWAEIEAAADRNGLAVAEVLRLAVAAGLPRVRDRLRKGRK